MPSSRLRAAKGRVKRRVKRKVVDSALDLLVPWADPEIWSRWFWAVSRWPRRLHAVEEAVLHAVNLPSRSDLAGLQQRLQALELELQALEAERSQPR